MARACNGKKRGLATHIWAQTRSGLVQRLHHQGATSLTLHVIHVEAIFDDNPFERCSALMDIYGVAVCVVEQLPNVNDALRFANRHQGRVFLAGYADLRDDQMVLGDQLSRALTAEHRRKTGAGTRSR